MNIETVLRELDLAHSVANEAMNRKDIVAYLDVFSDLLSYKQHDGEWIDKKRLSADTHRYFSRLKDVSTSFTRIDYSMEGDTFVERVVQDATFGIRLFLVFTKRWKLQREGEYRWRKEGEIWRIFNVEVFRETIK